MCCLRLLFIFNFATHFKDISNDFHDVLVFVPSFIVIEFIAKT